MINSVFSKDSQNEINTIMDGIKILLRQQKELDEKLTEQKNRLYELVGLNEMTTSEKITTDRWQVSFMVKNDYLKFNQKQFEQEQPKLFEQYKTQKANGSRYLDMSKSKEI
jgi:hypothetical protein